MKEDVTEESINYIEFKPDKTKMAYITNENLATLYHSFDELNEIFNPKNPVSEIFQVLDHLMIQTICEIQSPPKSERQRVNQLKGMEYCAEYHWSLHGVFLEKYIYQCLDENHHSFNHILNFFLSSYQGIFDEIEQKINDDEFVRLLGENLHNAYYELSSSVLQIIWSLNKHKDPATVEPKFRSRIGFKINSPNHKADFKIKTKAQKVWNLYYRYDLALKLNILKPILIKNIPQGDKEKIVAQIFGTSERVARDLITEQYEKGLNNASDAICCEELLNNVK